MKSFHSCALALMLLWLSACGFEPVYGVNKYTAIGAESRLAQIEIENIPNREGQHVRNALIDRFYRKARPETPLYSLHVAALEEETTELDITKSSDATRAEIRIRTVMTLRSALTNEILLQRDVRAITSYNILDSEFATRVTEENARVNALDDLARQIELQITLYFKRN
ncbi:MAG: hypothetical protein K9G62_05805 [Alphaproteobacteria bacterium]|nr:hypothetical protein [Alphaproteobacteria bacterium]